MNTPIRRPNSAMANAIFGPRDNVLEKTLRRSLLEDRMPTIQVDDNAGRVLQILTLMVQPKRAVEIGTLFGYSTVHIARGLPEEGHLVSYEIDPENAAVARRNLADAGLADKVDVVCEDAIIHLAGQEAGSLDLVFIDAAKAHYPDYLRAAYPLLRSGGLLVADDVLGDGNYTVETSQSDTEAETRGLAKYCRAVGRSSKLFSALIGTETGLMVSVKMGAK